VREEVGEVHPLLADLAEVVHDDLQVLLEFLDASGDPDEVVHPDLGVELRRGLPADGLDGPGAVPQLHLDEVLAVPGLLEIPGLHQEGLVDPLSLLDLRAEDAGGHDAGVRVSGHQISPPESGTKGGSGATGRPL
jgi:hypothetical protein